VEFPSRNLLVSGRLAPDPHPTREAPMLPPFIIEQIRQREEQKRWDDRPRLELPLDDMRAPKPRAPVAEPEVQRGVLIIDI